MICKKKSRKLGRNTINKRNEKILVFYNKNTLFCNGFVVSSLFLKTIMLCCIVQLIIKKKVVCEREEEDA